MRGGNGTAGIKSCVHQSLFPPAENTVSEHLKTPHWGALESTLEMQRFSAELLLVAIQNIRVLELEVLNFVDSMFY